MSQPGLKHRKKPPPKAEVLELSDLRNIGKAMLSDFEMLGIASVEQLAVQDADELYLRLSRLTGSRQDPCVHDTFAAAINQAKTGEALDWWSFTPLRKARQQANKFPS
jgi:hypothetical protein